MALDETQQQAPEQGQQPQNQRLSDEEEQDLSIMVNLSKEFIDDGGVDVIDQAVEQSSDPGTVIGQFLMQLASQISEQLPEDVEISPKIFFARGGWIEQISDYLQEQYGVSKEIMDKAEMFIGTAAQQMQQGEAAKMQQAQAPAAPAAPALPARGAV